MIRWILITFCLLVAGVSCLLPFPYYFFAYRPLEAEYTSRNAVWQEKMDAWKAAMKKETEDIRGSAIPVLTRGKDGDLGIWLIGNVAARAGVIEAREAVDDYYDANIRPLIRPHGQARNALIYQAGASVILTPLFLLAAILALWRGGILKGLLSGLLLGLFLAAPLGALWGWLALHLNSTDFLILGAVVAGGTLFVGLLIGIAGRLILFITAAKAPVEKAEGTA